MNKSCVYNWVQAASHTAGTTCCKSLFSVLLRTCRFLSFCCVCEVHLCLCVLTTAVASLQSEGSTSCSCVPSLCILRLCFLLFCVAVSDGSRTSSSSRCVTQSQEDLKRREANSWSYLLSVVQLRLPLGWLCFTGYYTSMEQKTVLTSDLMQVSNAKSMASNRGLCGDKGIILMETDKLCSHGLTSLYHRNGEAAKQSHFNQERRTTQGEWGLVIKVITGQFTAVVNGWQQECW